MYKGADQETLEGYVVDIACLRKYPKDEMLRQARAHTRDCALMGHCLESGYALVSEAGRVALLDTKATLQVVNVLQHSDQERGIKLRATRRRREQEMETIQVEEVA